MRRITVEVIKPAKFRSLVARAVNRPVTRDILSGNLRTISYFNLETLKKATKNFNQLNLLGRGGFGPVYLGKLDDGRLVAVKKLAVEKSQQGESQFLSEVRMITNIQHKNLVRLLGCCSDGAQRLLVYEYMKNRSLDLIVYGKNDIFLNWGTRFQIILGVARGLQYLHEDSHIRIIHRDIKASNILLDDIFQPRIRDFGLTRFFPEDQAYLSTAFAGTLGDILHRNGFVEKDVLHAIRVAFLCLQPQGNQRPRMSEIVAILTCKVELETMPTKPAFLERKKRNDEKTSWDSISEPFPSPLRSDSPTFPLHLK
ncbi:hypothetical protein SASPL_108983 [Salvia splendens]|uniref:non-specific serine/threonine protein kinase n=1 Tax=Salvia splendens TaxID=180675 RepID=A0A8X8YFN9_SALSN|nr:hypothetical protein SASPL_108983 [Salvia splendens]